MNPSFIPLPRGFSTALFFFISSLVGSGVASNPMMNTCEPKSCGSVQNISYPFWLSGEQPSYCGYPGFELECTDDTTILKISGQEFHILKIFLENNSALLVDAEFTKDDCSIPRTNLSFDGTLFNISTSNKELFFYPNCTVPPANSFAAISCNSTKAFSYLGGNYVNLEQLPFLTMCNTVILPVLGSAGSNGSDYKTLLKDGFLLDWTVPYCSECSSSGGQCGYNEKNAGFMCICPDGNHFSSCRSNSSHKKIAIGASAGLVGFLFVCLMLFIYLRNQRKYQHSTIFPKRKPNNAQSIEACLEKYGTLAPRRYTYSDVRRMTKSFTIKLGHGGYGTVFKGNLVGGHPVAVKVLTESKGDGEEFINEVASISRTSHVNIVSLLGFCLEGTKRALIYDFMPNGSLDRYIYTDKSHIEISLGWEKLYDIALGIAHGLEYLHRGCNTRIVHLDIKPHNILLDGEFCPKISDFGLAKLCLEKNSKISLVGTRGTVGYIAPEVFSRTFGVVSSKSDVYSYGMMVLEMVGGRKSIDAEAENTSEIDYPHWIYEHLNSEGDLGARGVAEEIEEIARKMMLVGLWCIQTLPEDRPSMNKVVDMLEGGSEDLQMPPKPYLSSPVESTHDSSIVSISYVDV